MKESNCCITVSIPQLDTLYCNVIVGIITNHAFIELLLMVEITV